MLANQLIRRDMVFSLNTDDRAGANAREAPGKMGFFDARQGPASRRREAANHSGTGEIVGQDDIKVVPVFGQTLVARQGLHRPGPPLSLYNASALRPLLLASSR